MRTKYHYLPILCIVAVIAGAFFLGRCTLPPDNSVATPEETSAVVAGYEQEAARNAEIIADKNDTILKLWAKIRISDAAIQKLEDKIKTGKKEYSEIKQEYVASDRHECDTLIAAADSVIDNQSIEIDTLKLQIADFKSVVLMQSGIIDIQREQLTAAERVINQLEASNRRTWWERNAKWVTLAGGLIIGSAGTAVIMR